MNQWLLVSLVAVVVAAPLGCSQKQKLATMQQEEEMQRSEIEANQRKIEEMKKRQQF